MHIHRSIRVRLEIGRATTAAVDDRQMAPEVYVDCACIRVKVGLFWLRVSEQTRQERERESEGIRVCTKRTKVRTKADLCREEREKKYFVE